VPELADVYTIVGDDLTDTGSFAAIRAAGSNLSFDAFRFGEFFSGSSFAVKLEAWQRSKKTLLRIVAETSIPSVLEGEPLNDTVLDATGTLMCRDKAQVNYISIASVEALRLELAADPFYMLPDRTDLKNQHTYLVPVHGSWVPETWKALNGFTVSGHHWSLLAFQISKPNKDADAVIQRLHHLDSAPDQSAIPGAQKEDEVYRLQRLAAYYVAKDVLPALGFVYSDTLADNLDDVDGPSKFESTKTNGKKIAVWQHRVATQRGVGNACGPIVVGLMDHIASGAGKVGKLPSSSAAENAKEGGKAQSEWLGASSDTLNRKARDAMLIWFKNVYGKLRGDNEDLFKVNFDQNAEARYTFLDALTVGMTDLMNIPVPPVDELALLETAQTDENE